MKYNHKRLHRAVFCNSVSCQNSYTENPLHIDEVVKDIFLQQNIKFYKSDCFTQKLDASVEINILLSVRKHYGLKIFIFFWKSIEFF